MKNSRFTDSQIVEALLACLDEMEKGAQVTTFLVLRKSSSRQKAILLRRLAWTTVRLVSQMKGELFGTLAMRRQGQARAGKQSFLKKSSFSVGAAFLP
ncbi:MAG: hypothetical protein RLZZ133_1671 [Pseudomonadota bacterium]|jgi:hypothetical protein